MSTARLDLLGMPLTPAQRWQLQVLGYRVTSDLNGVDPAVLSRDCNIPLGDAANIIRTSRPRLDASGRLLGAQSARQISDLNSAVRRIITFCGSIDEALGGGVTRGQLTEFCGVPAIGKTQLGLQLAIDVQIPECFGGVEKRALYIDCEGSFMLERAAQMADACIKHLKRIAAANKNAVQAQAADALTTQHLLDNILFLRIQDHGELVTAVQSLQETLKEHDQVGIVIIDSITFHFRQDVQDMALRTRTLAHIAQDLIRQAEDSHIAVVVMNQMTTKVLEDDHSRLVPALGDSWTHAATSRVMLYFQDQQRFACVCKSPCMPARQAQFVINSAGVRDYRSSKRARPGPASTS